jgi:hypothetical protein
MYDDPKDTYHIAILVNGRFFDGDDFLHTIAAGIPADRQQLKCGYFIKKGAS